MKTIGGKTMAVFGIMLALSGTALAYQPARTAEAVSVEVVSDRRGTLPRIPFQELWNSGTVVVKQHLEAQRQEVYSIVVRNDTPERVGVVIAVDGRNIIDGKRSNLGGTEAMYVVNGLDSARYDGWRTSSEEVRRFYFTDTRDSYSIRTFSDASALGVIAVAVFREKERPLELMRERGSKDRAPAAAPQAGAAAKSEKGAMAEENAGTGFGDARYSPVVTVQFEPEDRPMRKMLIKYAWRETLCRNGVLRCGQERKNRLWDGEGYAPYPPGYGSCEKRSR
jgi:hypothetical protein